MTFSSVSSNGTPQAAAVYVYMQSDFTSYCVTRESTRKYANVMDNSLVSISVFDENVLIFGEVSGDAEVIRNTNDVREVLPELQKIITARKSDYWIPPVSQLEGDAYVFFKITPQNIHFTNYAITNDVESAKPQVIDIAL